MPFETPPLKQLREDFINATKVEGLMRSASTETGSRFDWLNTSGARPALEALDIRFQFVYYNLLTVSLQFSEATTKIGEYVAVCSHSIWPERYFITSQVKFISTPVAIYLSSSSNGASAYQRMEALHMILQ